MSGHGAAIAGGWSVSPQVGARAGWLSAATVRPRQPRRRSKGVRGPSRAMFDGWVASRMGRAAYRPPPMHARIPLCVHLPCDSWFDLRHGPRIDSGGATGCRGRASHCLAAYAAAAEGCWTRAIPTKPKLRLGTAYERKALERFAELLLARRSTGGRD